MFLVKNLLKKNLFQLKKQEKISFYTGNRHIKKLKFKNLTNILISKEKAITKYV
jgi:hypothetical protein